MRTTTVATDERSTLRRYASCFAPGLVNRVCALPRVPVRQTGRDTAATRRTASALRADEQGRFLALQVEALRFHVLALLSACACGTCNRCHSAHDCDNGSSRHRWDT